MLWHVVVYEDNDLLPMYTIKAKTRVKTIHLLLGIIDEDLGGYEEIDVNNWQTSGVLQNQPKWQVKFLR